MDTKRDYSQVSKEESPIRNALDLGAYCRPRVTNLAGHSYASNNQNEKCKGSSSSDEASGYSYFQQGLRLLLAYQHEEASHHFLKSLGYAPNCALAHALIALCHGPNYNFKGEAYYGTSFPRNTKHENTATSPSLCVAENSGRNGDCCSQDDNDERSNKKEDKDANVATTYPSQLLAEYHSRLAVNKVHEIEKLHNNKRRNKNGTRSPTKHDLPDPIQDVEVMLIHAIRAYNCNPGADTSKAEQISGVPFALAMKKIYQMYPQDPEVAYFFAESIMILHAWKLFDYPSARPTSDQVHEVKTVLEDALGIHPSHVGLCHMYVHLCEMAPYPEKALPACEELRTRFPEAGHLLHMPTHIDVLVGDYDACVHWNNAAIQADMKAMTRSPETSCVSSFYFGYIAHNYHMLIYGAMLGAMEGIAMKVARELNTFLTEDLFEAQPNLAVYLESYATMDIHVLVRFGRWETIVKLELPKNQLLMLYRSACVHYAKAIAHANFGNIQAAKDEATEYEKLRAIPDAKKRILHNNTIADLLDVDSLMIKGEIAFFEGNDEDAFDYLHNAIQLQDNLNYDEPWGKMQPIRHALGGLLIKRGFFDEAEEVFRADLKRLPKNPWSIQGLIKCITYKLKRCLSTNCPCEERLSSHEISFLKDEVIIMEEQYLIQRKSRYADYEVTHSCACCVKKDCKQKMNEA